MWWVKCGGLRDSNFYTSRRSKLVCRQRDRARPPPAIMSKRYIIHSVQLTCDHGVPISRRVHGNSGDSRSGGSRRHVFGLFHGFSTTDGPVAVELRALGGPSDGVVITSRSKPSRNTVETEKNRKIQSTRNEGWSREKRFFFIRREEQRDDKRNRYRPRWTGERLWRQRNRFAGPIPPRPFVFGGRAANRGGERRRRRAVQQHCRR